MRQYSFLDQFCDQVQSVMQTLCVLRQPSARPRPDQHITDPLLTATEKKLSGRLMRVNHCGEICAQALYQSQGLATRSSDLRATMQHAADEELDHLDWCAQRLQELDTHASFFTPFFYHGSWSIGFVAGIISDEYSLGFLAETERQVETHLSEHLHRLPTADLKSRAIVEQMQADEKQHAETALAQGAKTLGPLNKWAMRCMSRVMKWTTYWV